MGFVDRYFKLSERGSNFRTELVAGVTTFMTMSYILIVHPTFMSVGAGMDKTACVVAVAFVCGLVTLAMGLYANLPFALAPGMGGNAFFAFTLVKGGIVPWQVGMGMVFISGAVFILLTVFGVREVVVRLMPRSIKLAIGAAVGIFIAQLGLKSAGILVIDKSMRFGNLHDAKTLLSIVGLFVTAGFIIFRVRGALLWGIVLTSIIGIPMGITKVPSTLLSTPASIEPIFLKLDILGALKWTYIPFMFTFFVGDFFSTLGTVLGVGGKAGLLDENGDMPDIGKPFLVDAIGTLVGSLFGLTTVTTFVESASGVEEGGRTGLTAIVTAVCFFLMLLLVPLASCVPEQATAPVLVIIGLMMMPAVQNIDFNDFTESFPAFMTILMAAYLGLANGISSGILCYTAAKVLAGRGRELHWGTYVLCVPIIGYFLNL
ncbi:MAG: NCS2 family permease [Fretibacterium sp.]|nr:NCS2 family permease [Fretibacterium sp.]